MPRLAAAPLTHQLLTARLLVGLLKDKPDPLVHLDVFEREIMADGAALLVDADHAEGLEIRARVREEMAAIVQVLRDGLRQLGGWDGATPTGHRVAVSIRAVRGG